MAETKTVTKPTNDIVAQVVEKVKAGDNILVALSNNPSVDEMAAAIGMTLVLDKMGKHATAIFSGQVPNTLEFLNPGDTFESNTNSLQDFIIALNKEKADHLRYKIEGDYVKVFITPYRTTIDEGDLEFSHGDFNVDLVFALNVAAAGDLDGALSEHGRIMHNASSINLTTSVPGKFGDLEWNNPAASSVSEMVGILAEKLGGEKENLVDAPVATAVLTGIVAATNRFSNERTAPSTMVMASKLMEKGADQQLISSNIPVDLATGAPAGAAAAPAAVPVEAVPAPQAPVEDATVIDVQRREEPVAAPVEAEVPAVAETPKVEETPEQELEKVIEPPVSHGSIVGGGPLMDELRAASADGLKVGDLGYEAPKRDYSALIEQELQTPIGEPVAAPSETPAENLAAQVAPSVSNQPEVNSLPVINYAQIPESSPEVTAPTGVEQSYVATQPPVASPLPMPSAEMLPPPPPPPFNPEGVVSVTPVPVVPAPTPAPTPVAQTVMPTVAPIAPATPTVETHTYLGSNPAMPDQVYPADPGAFKLPSL